MLEKLKSIFVPNNEPIIRFKSTIQGYEVGQPVCKASDIKPEWLVQQNKNADKNKSPKFSACPGMDDYYRAGYIIPAWEDFRIIVDAKHAHIEIGTGRGNPPCPNFEVMDYRVVEGAAPIDKAIAKHALKLPCPWKVFTKKGYSAFVMPALFHSPFLGELFPYPGINDYDGYHTINVMFSPLKEMDLKIYAGTPMLHVIPYKREDITCEVGFMNPKEHGEAEFTYRSKKPGLYRKMFHNKKKYDIKYLDK